MDIDEIRELLQSDQFSTTEEFEDRLDERRIDIEQVIEAILNGRIIRTEPGTKGMSSVHTLRGTVLHDKNGNTLSIPVTLEIAVAVPLDLVLITVYWPRD